MHRLRIKNQIVKKHTITLRWVRVLSTFAFRSVVGHRSISFVYCSFLIVSRARSFLLQIDTAFKFAVMWFPFKSFSLLISRFESHYFVTDSLNLHLLFSSEELLRWVSDRYRRHCSFWFGSTRLTLEIAKKKSTVTVSRRCCCCMSLTHTHRRARPCERRKRFQSFLSFFRSMVLWLCDKMRPVISGLSRTHWTWTRKKIKQKQLFCLVCCAAIKTKSKMWAPRVRRRQTRENRLNIKQFSTENSLNNARRLDFGSFCVCLLWFLIDTKQNEQK